jgi:hypothetical protein
MKRILIGLLLLAMASALAFAQGGKPAPAAAGKQQLILAFVDGDSPDLKVTLSDKTVLQYPKGIAEDASIPQGATVKTGAGTSIELKLKPNGSIIKLAQNTSFTVAALAGSPQQPNAFANVAGKLRMVAAKGAQYQLSSSTAVCAVRGTDFVFDVEEGTKALLLVSKGLVQFDKLDAAGKSLGSIPVAAGEMADALAEAFAAVKYSAEQLAQQVSDVNFKSLQETDVPDQAGQADSGAKGSAASAAESGLMKWLRDALGFEIGSVTINDATYSKAIIQPNLAFGKVKLGLYLPIIYSSNLFDSSDWYHPKGNDEWSFGTSQFAAKDYMGGAIDLATDIALKIKYFEYGTQLKDPFFIKVGNLEDLTLGHGLIMRNYANDTDFPTIRRLGFEMGLDSGKGGFELVANDLTDPQIFGARLFMRPGLGSLALGWSAVVDWNPASVDPGLGFAPGALKLIGTGVDLDLPIVQSDLLGIRAFADGAVTVPYTTEKLGASDKPGLQYQIVWDSATKTVKNWGAAAGLMGNVLFIDWRLEYRYFTGIFRPSFFDGTYDRMRGQYAAQYADAITNPTGYDATPNVMGIYGEGGFKLLKDKLDFGFGYMWPWAPGASASDQLVLANDEFHATLAIKKGLIPIVDLAGSITYEKRGLAKSLVAGNFKFLDENTIFGGEIDVPVPKTPNLDLAVVFLTVPVRDSNGDIVYDDAAKGIPQLKPSITIETRFHF